MAPGRATGFGVARAEAPCATPGLTITRLVASWLQPDVGDAIDLTTLPTLAPMNPSCRVAPRRPAALNQWAVPPSVLASGRTSRCVAWS